jgi:hypothetical protein
VGARAADRFNWEELVFSREEWLIGNDGMLENIIGGGENAVWVELEAWFDSKNEEGRSVNEQ